MLWDSIPEDERDDVRDAALERVEGWRDEDGRVVTRHKIRLTLAQRP